MNEGIRDSIVYLETSLVNKFYLLDFSD